MHSIDMDVHIIAVMDQVKVSLGAYQESQAYKMHDKPSITTSQRSMSHSNQREPSASAVMECATNRGYKEVRFEVHWNKTRNSPL